MSDLLEGSTHAWAIERSLHVDKTSPDRSVRAMSISEFSRTTGSDGRFQKIITLTTVPSSK